MHHTYTHVYRCLGCILSHDRPDQSPDAAAWLFSETPTFQDLLAALQAACNYRGRGVVPPNLEWCSPRLAPDYVFPQPQAGDWEFTPRWAVYPDASATLHSVNVGGTGKKALPLPATPGHTVTEAPVYGNLSTEPLEPVYGNSDADGFGFGGVADDPLPPRPTKSLGPATVTETDVDRSSVYESMEPVRDVVTPPHTQRGI